jgi:hypothetical protein
MRYTCVINSVGPISNNDMSIYIDPGTLPGPPTNPFFIVLILTDLANNFKSQWFFVDAGGENYMLAVALAAINTGAQVTADVDWPRPVLGTDQSGNPILGIPYCHLLQINAT